MAKLKCTGNVVEVSDFYTMEAGDSTEIGYLLNQPRNVVYNAKFDFDKNQITISWHDPAPGPAHIGPDPTTTYRILNTKTLDTIALGSKVDSKNNATKAVDWDVKRLNRNRVKAVCKNDGGKTAFPREATIKDLVKEVSPALEQAVAELAHANGFEKRADAIQSVLGKLNAKARA